METTLTDAPTGNLTQDNSTNNPPEEIPKMPVAPAVATIEAAIRGEHKKFLADAEAWIQSVDRAPAVIADEKQAAAFAKTISELTKARNGAEKIHSGLKAPWFNITKAIDAIFLAGVSKRAAAAEALMVARQKVWIRKVEEENRKAAALEAQRLEDEAAAAAAREAEQLKVAERAMDVGDFDTAQTAMEEAAQHNEQAQGAAQEAAVAQDRSEAKTSTLVRQHHATGVTTSARTFWNAELLDLSKLDDAQELKFWRALAPYIGSDDRLKAAKAAAKAGLRDCPGIRIFDDFTPTNRG